VAPSASASTLDENGRRSRRSTCGPFLSTRLRTWLLFAIAVPLAGVVARAVARRLERRNGPTRLSRALQTEATPPRGVTAAPRRTRPDPHARVLGLDGPGGSPAFGDGAGPTDGHPRAGFPRLPDVPPVDHRAMRDAGATPRDCRQVVEARGHHRGERTVALALAVALTAVVAPPAAAGTPAAPQELHTSPSGATTRARHRRPAVRDSRGRPARGACPHRRDDVGRRRQPARRTYRLDRPFRLSERRRRLRRGGHRVVYQAYGYGTRHQERVTLSGGRPVTGLAPDARHPGTWLADVGGLETRQLST
jgi:hypothetical protein